MNYLGTEKLIGAVDSTRPIVIGSVTKTIIRMSQEDGCEWREIAPTF